MKKPRKPYKVSAPMLVNRHLYNTDMELRERMAVTAFSGGFANTQHFDTLLAMLNLLKIAGEHRADMKQYADNVLQPVMQSIRDRYGRTQKLGVSADELKVLRALPDVSKAFWNGQSVGFYNDCIDELNAYYSDLAEKRAA